MTATTEAIWSERVRSWRQSGESATVFARGKDYTASTLRYWASRLRRTSAAPRIVQLVPTAKVPDATPAAADLVVEVGTARVRVRRGFDPELLAEVVRALGGAR